MSLSSSSLKCFLTVTTDTGEELRQRVILSFRPLYQILKWILKVLCVLKWIVTTLAWYIVLYNLQDLHFELMLDCFTTQKKEEGTVVTKLPELHVRLWEPLTIVQGGRSGRAVKTSLRFTGTALQLTKGSFMENRNQEDKKEHSSLQKEITVKIDSQLITTLLANIAIAACSTWTLNISQSFFFSLFFSFFTQLNNRYTLVFRGRMGWSQVLLHVPFD